MIVLLTQSCAFHMTSSVCNGYRIDTTSELTNDLEVISDILPISTDEKLITEIIEAKLDRKVKQMKYIPGDPYRVHLATYIVIPTGQNKKLCYIYCEDGKVVSHQVRLEGNYFFN